MDFTGCTYTQLSSEGSALKKVLIKNHIGTFTFCFLLLNFTFFNLDIMSALSKHAMLTLKLDTETFANISAYGFYANLFSLIFWGSLLDKFNIVIITKIILLIVIIASLMFSIFINVPSFVFYRVITGFLVGVAFPACMRVVAIKAPHKAGFITGLYGLAAMGGGIIAQSPVVVVLHLWGLQALFLIISLWGIIILNIPINLLQSPIDALPHFKQPVRYPIFSAMKNIHNWLMAIYVGLLNLPIFVLGDLWSNLYLTQKITISESFAACITSMIFLGHIVGSILLGLCSDKTQIRKPIMLGGVMLAIFSLISIQYAENIGLLVVLYLLLGVGISAQVVGFSYVAISSSTAATASSTAILSLMSVFLGAMFQKISGHILENNKVAGTAIYSLNAYNKIIIVLIICLIISFIVSLFIKIKISA